MCAFTERPFGRQEKPITSAIEDLCLANAQHVAKDQSMPTWPFNIVMAEWYKDRLFLPELWGTINRLETSGLANEEIARLFRNPTRISNILHFVKCPFDPFNKDARLELVEKLTAYLRYFRREDSFCLTGKNIVRGGEELAQRIQTEERGLFPANLSSMAYKLHGIAWAHTEMLWVQHGCGHELHGPYTLGKETAIIREYYDLRPVDLRPATGGLSFDQLTTVSFYPDDFEIEFDMFGHSYSSPDKQDFINRFAILVDNQLIEKPAQLQKILNELLTVNAADRESTASFTERDWLANFVEMHLWGLKPHKDCLGESWKPSENFYQLMDTQVIPHEALRDFGAKWNGIWELPSELERRQKFQQLFLGNLLRE